MHVIYHAFIICRFKRTIKIIIEKVFFNHYVFSSKLRIACLFCLYIYNYFVFGIALSNIQYITQTVTICKTYFNSNEISLRNKVQLFILYNNSVSTMQYNDHCFRIFKYTTHPFCIRVQRCLLCLVALSTFNLVQTGTIFKTCFHNIDSRDKCKLGRFLIIYQKQMDTNSIIQYFINIDITYKKYSPKAPCIDQAIGQVTWIM